MSELRRQHGANPGVRGWFREHRHAELWLSVLVLGELRRGVELIRRRDPDGAEALDAWLTSVADDFDTRILDVTPAIAQRWGTLGVPDPVPVVDGLLAATAIEHDLVLVTRTVDDVARTGVGTLDPFT